MKLLALCLMAVVCLQLAVEGNTKTRTSSSITLSKRGPTPGGRAFDATLKEAVKNGRFEDGYFETPEWKEMAETISKDPELPITWNEANVIKVMKSYVSDNLDIDAAGYNGNFFNSPEWIAYKKTAPETRCAQPGPEFFEAADKEFQTDWRFGAKFIVAIVKLCERP